MFEKKKEEKANGAGASPIIEGELMVPFKVTKVECEEAVLTWLSEGDNTPDDILDSTVITSFKEYFIPVYVFIGRFRGNWSASSGYNRTEHYLDTNFSGNKTVTRTRTVTDWRPVSGQIDDGFIFSIYGGPSRKDINNEVMEVAEGFSAFGSGEALSKTGLYEFVDFASDYRTIWSDHGDDRVDRIAKVLIANRIPGDEKRDLSFDVSSELKRAIAAYVPMWSLQCRYKDESFNVCVDGADQSKVIGDRPEKLHLQEKSAFLRYLPGHFGVLSTIILMALGARGIESMGPNVYLSLCWFALVLTVYCYIRPGIQTRRDVRFSKHVRRMKLDDKLRGSKKVKSSVISAGSTTQPTKTVLTPFRKHTRADNYFRIAGLGLALWPPLLLLLIEVRKKEIIDPEGGIFYFLFLLVLLGLPITIITFAVKGMNKWTKEVDSE